MDPKLYEAAAKGEIEPFKEIANANRELGSIVSHNKSSILHVYIASQAQNRERQNPSAKFVEQILEMCPSLLAQVNAEGDSPLHVAAKYGHVAAVKFMIKFAKEQPNNELESGVDKARQILGMTNEKQNTALHEAVLHHSIDVVKMLIEADPHVPYSTNGSGETPLYIAAEKGSVEMVTEILENSPSAAHEGPNGKTALHAAVNCYAEGVTGKIVEKKNKSLTLTRVQDELGWTPLHYAAYRGRFNISKLLLNYDEFAACIGDKDQKMTALHLAAGRGHIEIVKEMISSCPTSCDVVDVRGWNYLHFAMVSLNGMELANLLRLSSVRRHYNVTDVNGYTPLHLLAAVCRDLTKEIVIPNDYKVSYEHNFSIQSTIHHGNREIEQVIEELSNYAGRERQYPDGVIKVKKEKMLLDEEGFKETKQRHSVVATLIATITFAAAFTLPGGYWGKEGPIPGTPILRRNPAFQIFVISDAIAMILSLSAVFVYFLIGFKALRRFINLFNLAAIFTMVSMVAMVAAFVAGTYAMLSHSSGLSIATCFLGLSFNLFVLFAIYLFLSKFINRLRLRDALISIYCVDLTNVQ